MNPKWAEENLQTIRTLMERSAVYRRALAPVMLVCGMAGVAGGLAGWHWQLNSYRAFVSVWASTALFALTCSILLMRKQALKESEPFWSAPTRRIAQALTPPFLIGAVVTGALSPMDWGNEIYPELIAVLVCSLMYGCGIHAAGFFMPRGIRWLGWLFLLAGFGIIGAMLLQVDLPRTFGSMHLLMGLIFGGLHLAYGSYLYFTERKNPAA